jgi:hypothetical protein
MTDIGAEGKKLAITCSFFTYMALFSDGEKLLESPR